ncbi:DUF406 family protein [Endozoicomonas elysicola]|uniref:DUF406 family protein n=1 Tax=Endozoicomonas elysicola TaxID=305900 RepID=UPI000360B246|nr:DUF406 family protein [Endozoicomonas elysicola]
MTSVTNLNDTRVDMDIRTADLKEGMEHFQKLKFLAHKIETDPCKIICETSQVNDSTLIHAHFDFCCAVEKIIFQMNCQFNSDYRLL